MKTWKEIALHLIHARLTSYEEGMRTFTWDDLDKLWIVLDGILEDNHPEIMRNHSQRISDLRFSDKAQIPGVHYKAVAIPFQNCGGCMFFEIPNWHSGPIDSECLGDCTFNHLPDSMTVANRERTAVRATDGRTCKCYVKGAPKRAT